MKPRIEALRFVPTHREGWDTDIRFGFDAVIADKVVGHILVQRARKNQWTELWVVEGVVVTDFFRMGIGTALYEEALLEAEKRGGRLASECRATEYTIAFWEKQLKLGRVEILAPPRWGTVQANSLLVVKPGVKSLG